ncbi:GNAT family N-acetyltransferase [Clostridium sp.]|uniref:GNAT family N-acetyltransferase n=1 Tax=Clostridium sp. TaxID=1506 RepID=UPI0026044FDD|nr:GNAT family protein [uncultured Clostridium sp.]
MENLVVRELIDEDALALLKMNIDNKEYFEKWAPIKLADSYYSLDGQLESIRSAHKKIENDESYSYGIFLEKSNIPIGYLAFAFVQRGALQSAMIGYNISEKYTGKGYATKAVLLSLEIAFKTLHLHRITAGVEPENIGSLRVLEKAGFSREGYSPKVLKVNEQWRDIINMAVLEEDM